MTTPPFAPVDEPTADLLTLVADTEHPVGRDAVEAFLAACKADADSHGGLVSVNRVRARLADQQIDPRRYSSLWSAFTGKGKPMRKADERDPASVGALRGLYVRQRRAAVPAAEVGRMTDLLTLARKHDLPPRWDGCITTWRGWEPLPIAHICPPPKRRCCSGCGSAEEPVLNVGTVCHSPRTTHAELRHDAENRKRLRRLAYKRPLLATMRLYAFRCQDCRADEVWDRKTDEWWTLDHTDYGDNGSVAP